MPPLFPDDLDHVLARTPGVWDALRDRRVFVTGGTGFYGCWLLETFAWANDRLRLGAEAVVLTRDPGAFGRKVPHLAGHPAIRLYRGDVLGFEPPAGPFHFAIHAATAASAALNDAEPLAMFDAVLRGTRNVLDAAVGWTPDGFLLTSSGAVYGRQPPDLARVPEDFPGGPDPLDPRSAYAEGKRAAEHLCAIYRKRYGLPAKVSRGFAFVGPHLPLDAHFAAGNFLRDGLAGGPVRVGGDGTPYRSYLYAADLAAWLWTILVRGRPGRAYNTGSDEPVSVAELAGRVGRLCGCGVRVAKEPTPGAAAERYVPDTSRAKGELELGAWVGLDDALRRTADWHRNGTQT